MKIITSKNKEIVRKDDFFDCRLSGKIVVVDQILLNQLKNSVVERVISVKIIKQKTLILNNRMRVY